MSNYTYPISIYIYVQNIRYICSTHEAIILFDDLLYYICKVGVVEDLSIVYQ
jgi:hypothetical protein